MGLNFKLKVSPPDITEEFGEEEDNLILNFSIDGIKYSKMVTLPHKSIIGREKLEQKARDILMSIYDNTIKFINEGGIID